MFDEISIHAARNARARDIDRLERRAKDNQRRNAMVNVIWEGLRGALSHAPDLFPDIDSKRLAERCVDELILGGRE